MKRNEKTLYEKIMWNVAREVKRALNEDEYTSTSTLDMYNNDLEDEVEPESEEDIVNNNFTEKELYPQTKRDLVNTIKKFLKLDIMNLNYINVSEIRDMSGVFYEPYISPEQAARLDVSKWDVSNVFDFSYMFYGLKTFNGDLSNWDVSNAVYFRNMFYRCEEFNGDLSNWDVHHATYMTGMFDGCIYFDCDLSKWDTYNFIDCRNMFYNCKSFKGKGLSKWNMLYCRDFDGMFFECISFKEDISTWKVKTGQVFRYMFAGCDSLQCNFEPWGQYINNINRLIKIKKQDLTGMFDDCESLTIPSWYKKYFNKPTK